MAWIYHDPLGHFDDEEFPTKAEAIEYARIMEDDDCMETLAELNVFEKREDVCAFHCRLDLQKTDSPHTNSNTIHNPSIEEKYSYTCPICGEAFDEDFFERTSPQYLLVTEYASEKLNIDSGVYEIMSYPSLINGLIDENLFDSAVNRISDLPSYLDDDDLWSDIYYVCDKCIEKMRDNHPKTGDV